MRRLSVTIIAACMVLIALALGAVLFLVFGLTGAEATVSAVTALSALGLYHVMSIRLRDRANLADQIADLARASSEMSRQIAELSRRVVAVEKTSNTTLVGPSGAPLTAEMSELGTLVKQLADTVAAHDAALTAIRAQRTAAAEPPALAAPHDAAAAEPPEAPQPAMAADMSADAPAPSSEPAPPAANEQIVATIRAAIEANRADLYLQPIVTLPQRKVRYYEALTRLRDDAGRLLLPSDFLPAAETTGLISQIDHLNVFRCVQVLRRLQVKNREIGLFCNIAMATLSDNAILPQILEFMEANRALASTLFLEFKQSVWHDMGPIELESLATLRELGFRFSMDQVTDLRMEPRELADRGVRFVKAPAGLLLGRTQALSTDIHAADLSDLLSRHGINLIADRIENEAEVVDLLEFDLRFGQGLLFSAPRPVRAEALQGGERPGASARAEPAVTAEPVRRTAPAAGVRAAAALGG